MRLDVQTHNDIMFSSYFRNASSYTSPVPSVNSNFYHTFCSSSNNSIGKLAETSILAKLIDQWCWISIKLDGSSWFSYKAHGLS